MGYAYAAKKAEEIVVTLPPGWPPTGWTYPPSVGVYPPATSIYPYPPGWSAISITSDTDVIIRGREFEVTIATEDKKDTTAILKLLGADENDVLSEEEIVLSGGIWSGPITITGGNEYIADAKISVTATNYIEDFVEIDIVSPALVISSCPETINRNISFLMTIEAQDGRGNIMGDEAPVVTLSLVGASEIDILSLTEVVAEDGLWTGLITVSGGTGTFMGAKIIASAEGYISAEAIFDIDLQYYTIEFSNPPNTEDRCSFLRLGPSDGSGEFYVCDSDINHPAGDISIGLSTESTITTPGRVFSCVGVNGNVGFVGYFYFVGYGGTVYNYGYCRHGIVFKRELSSGDTVNVNITPSSTYAGVYGKLPAQNVTAKLHRGLGFSGDVIASHEIGEFTHGVNFNFDFVIP